MSNIYHNGIPHHIEPMLTSNPCSVSSISQLEGPQSGVGGRYIISVCAHLML